VKIFDLGPEIDIGYRPVTINERMDFRILGTCMPDANHTLGSLIVLFLEELLNGAEPIRLDDDIVIQKGQQVSLIRQLSLFHCRRLAVSVNLQKRQRKRKTVCYAVQEFPCLILGIIVGDNDLRLRLAQPLKFPDAIKQVMHYPGTVPCGNNDAEFNRHGVNPRSRNTL